MMKTNKDNVSDEKRINELLRYGFAGITTTLLNLVIYQAGIFVGGYYRNANLCAILVSKIYAYIINKKMVFHSHCNTFHDLLKEIALYILTRGITGVTDYLGLIYLVDVLALDRRWAKYVIQAIVIMLNYFLGKYMVFRKSSLPDMESVANTPKKLE